MGALQAKKIARRAREADSHMRAAGGETFDGEQALRFSRAAGEEICEGRALVAAASTASRKALAAGGWATAPRSSSPHDVEGRGGGIAFARELTS